jgi:DNA-binding ferritin-like protein
MIDIDGIVKRTLTESFGAPILSEDANTDKISGDLFASALAALQLLFLVHRHNHWESKGPTSYGDHLMFERLYKSADDDMDALAEKAAGLLGAECISLAAVHAWLDRHYGEVVKDTSLTLVQRGR